MQIIKRKSFVNFFDLDQINLESIFKPMRKFSRLTRNIKKINLGVLSMCKVSVKSENLLGSGGREGGREVGREVAHYHASLWSGQVWGVVVR